MLDQSAPRNIVDVARALQVSPFEVIRLVVVSGSELPELQLTHEQVTRITAMGGIEHWWSDERPIGDDDNPSRRLLRSAMQLLLDRELLGGHTARVDNLWRGLEEDEAETLRQGLAIWLQEGWAILSSSPQGAQVSIAEDQVDTVRAFAGSGAAPGVLSAIWES